MSSATPVGPTGGWADEPWLSFLDAHRCNLSRLQINRVIDPIPIPRYQPPLSGFATSDDPRQQLQFAMWCDLVRTDRNAMARLLLLTGFSPNFLAAMEPSAVLQAIDDIVASNNWEGMARQVELDLTVDVRGQAQRMTQPTLVIGCTHDYMVPPAHSHDLANLIPNARYLEIEAGHLSKCEKPDQIAQSILDFVA